MKTAFTIVVLLCLLAFAGVLAYEGWTMGGQPVDIGFHGVLAIILGVVGTAVIGGGLMYLLFYSSRRGYDDAADEWYRHHGAGRHGPGHHGPGRDGE
ncbi:MAG TPA: hypothetical protein VK943_12375 [Arenibaculum sp.]|nr:hypothetical protein [Arenibaculum sp.]